MSETPPPIAPSVMPTPAQPGWADSFSETVKTVLYAVVIALGFRSIAYEPFNIPSESMLPGLLVGDYLFVSKYSYGFSRYSIPFGLPLFEGRLWDKSAERGDVVVFKLPSDNKTDYIKRIVGLPGDIIEVRGGVLMINGEAATRKPIADFLAPPGAGGVCAPFGAAPEKQPDGDSVCRYPRYHEALPNSDKNYDTLAVQPDGPRNNTRKFVVPAGHYFAMGDNRDNSTDSRVDPAEGGVGFIPAENLVGKAQIRFFSTDGSARWWNPLSWFTAARYSRFFTRIQ